MGISLIRISENIKPKYISQVSSSAMWILEFDKDLKVFEWTKVRIGDTGARAFHSSAFLQKMNSVVLVGGICSNEEGITVRHKMGVVIVNTSTWAWAEYVASDSICLSSTKILPVGDNKLAYFGKLKYVFVLFFYGTLPQ